MTSSQNLQEPLLGQTIAVNAADFVAIRRAIHSHPELGFAEWQTAALVEKQLREMGLEPIRMAQTGVVAVIDSGRPGKTVALRAELDALPIAEKTALSYQSTLAGQMHACGHDGHTASLLLAAKALCVHRKQFSGKVKLIFQPAEEACKGGASAMIAAGVLENPKVDALFAYHNHPGFSEGIVLTRFGSALSGSTNIIIKITGKGGHAATPEHNVDPIQIGAMIVQAFPIINQQVSLPDAPVVMRVTEFNSGVSSNVVPEVAILAGTLRTTSVAQREQAKQKIQNLVQHICQAQGAAVELELSDRIPPTVNADAETALVFATARRLLGEQQVQTKFLPARASEDAAFYLEKIPGCYFFMGNGVDSPSCHSSHYDFNDAILSVAAELLAELVIDYLNVA